MELIRSAKSGSNFTSHDLRAYQIHVVRQSTVDFFGSAPSNLPPSLPPNFSEASLNTPGISGDTRRLLRYLDLATRAHTGQESAIDDLAKEILRASGYEEDELDTILRSRVAIPLTICGDSTRMAQTDVSLLHSDSTILLVVQEDKTNFNPKDPEPQVIAEAIAAFQYNNRRRDQMGLDQLDEMVFPCITLIGTRPVFYKVPVTKELSEAVISGQYPTVATTVTKCIVGDGARRLSEGMEQPQYRVEALKYYESFRQLARCLYTQFIV